MQQHVGLFLFVVIVLLVVILNIYMFWWIKAVIGAYYTVISYYFISGKDSIDKQYEDDGTVPEVYWVKNSEWVDTIADYYFWPLLAILLFIYFKWFTGVQSKKGKLLVGLSLFPVSLAYLFFIFMFVFVYGYRP